MKMPVVFLFLLMLLTSCVKLHDYPKGWSKLKEFSSPTCPSIAGIYNDCSDASSNSYGCSLYYEFARLAPLESNPPSSSCNSDRRVELQQPDSDTLVVIGLNNEIILNRQFTRGADTKWERDFHFFYNPPTAFECENSSLVLKMKTIGIGVGEACYSNQRLFLYQTVNGDLVIQDKVEANYQMYIVPLLIIQKYWCRWHRVN